MSWRERYKNHEARFDHHIKAFQNKNKISKRAAPIGFEATLLNGMEDLDDFGTDEEEDRRPRGKRPARVDSDTVDENEEPSKARPGPVNKSIGTPKRPVSKRKRASDTNDRTPKRSKAIEGNGSGEASSNGLTGGKEDDVMIDLDESETDSPITPKRTLKRRIPKIVESAFGRNEQSHSVRSPQTRADSRSVFDLLVESRAARRAVASKHLEAHSSRYEVTREERRELQRATPEPGPSSSSVSKRGSSPPSQLTSRLRPRPPSSTTSDDAEKKMIEAREELSKVTLRFQDRFPRSPLGSKSPETRADDGESHPFDETTQPFYEATRPFDESTHPFDDSQTQTQEVHPFDGRSHTPSQELPPFDENTQRTQDSILDGQNKHRELELEASGIPIRSSPVTHTPRGSKYHTQEPREMLRNSPQMRRKTAGAEFDPQTRGEA